MHMPPFDDHPVSEDWERLMVEHQHKEVIGQALVVDTKPRHFMRRANEKLKSLPTETASQLACADQLTHTKDGWRFKPWEKLSEELLRDRHFYQFVFRSAMARLHRNYHGFAPFEIVAALSGRPLSRIIDYCQEWFGMREHKGRVLISWTFYLLRDRKGIGRDANLHIAGERSQRGEKDKKGKRVQSKPAAALGLKDAPIDPIESHHVPKLTIEEREMIKESIEQLLKQLAAKDRTIIEKLFSGYRPKEIAEDLGIPLGTVYSCIYRSRDLLKELL